MARFHAVQVADPRAFIEEAATFGYDDLSMNFVLGTLADSYIECRAQAKNLADEDRTLFVVHRGDALVLAFLRVTGYPHSFLCSPRNGELNVEEVPDAMAQLVEAVANTRGFDAVDNVSGPNHLVDAFITTWVSVLSIRGIQAHGQPPSFNGNLKASSATLATLPTTPATLPGYTIETAVPQDLDELAAFAVDFSAHWTQTTALADARARMEEHLGCGEAWVCRAHDGDLAAFCIVGRNTPRTLAIRNLYVAPAHRKKGLAGAFTTGILRYFLGVPEHGVRKPQQDCFAKDTKQEICINVAEEHTERMYTRCGFQFGGDSGEADKRTWFPIHVRAVKVESSQS